jgi:hypothetical protein
MLAEESAPDSMTATAIAPITTTASAPAVPTRWARISFQVSSDDLTISTFPCDMSAQYPVFGPAPHSLLAQTDSDAGVGRSQTRAPATNY